MPQFLFRRVGQTLLALFALSILTFLLVRPDPYAVFLPTNDVSYLERPHPVIQYGETVGQYADYMNNLVHGNWGKSWKWGGEAIAVVLDRFPTTLRLASIALALSVALGITLGILAAIKKGSPFDQWTTRVVLLGGSMPVFWLGVILSWSFAIFAGSLPRIGEGESYPLILPIITLAWLPTVVLTKFTRSAMLSALESDYVKLARIKGLSECKIIWKHCLRNVSVSPLLSFTLIGGAFMTSLVLTEAVFAWPGAGLLVVDAIRTRDHVALHGVVLFLGGGFILCHLTVDVLRAFLDPRIRYSESRYLNHQVAPGR